MSTATSIVSSDARYQKLQKEQPERVEIVPNRNEIEEEDNSRQLQHERLSFPPPEYSRLHGFLQRRLSNKRGSGGATNRPSTEMTTYPTNNRRSRGASTASDVLEYVQDEQTPSPLSITGSPRRSSSYKYTRLRHKRPLFRSQSDDVFGNIQHSPPLLQVK